MANNDLAMRFTEEKYATKNEVARELKVSSVDAFWANILAYRSNFYHYLTIRTIENKMLLLCGCPAVNNLVNAVEMKLIRANREYGLVDPKSKGYHFVDNTFKRDILNNLNELEQLGVDKGFVDSVLRNEVISAIPSNMLLVNYLEALNYIKTAYVNAIDENFLAALYGKLFGTDELTHFYRNSDDKNPENRILIDRIYTSAPWLMIDKMLGNLFNFIASSTLSTSLKAIVTYFYINYVKPFDKYTEEMAILMAKAVLAHEAYGETIVDMPLEKILNLSSEESARIYVEVQKTADLTYFVNYALNHFNKYLDAVLDEIAKSKVEEMKVDFYQTDEEAEEEIPEEKIPETYVEEGDQLTLFNNVEEEK